jgi:hypothetical protein
MEESMFCPQCKAEYRPGFVRCADCDVELVDCLPQDAVESGTTEDSDYTVIRAVQGALEEGQICSFLQAYGIPTQVRSVGFRKTYAVSINGGGAIQILVPRDLAVTAIDLLAKADRGELEIAPDADTSTERGT